MTRNAVAASVAQTKIAHPERYCQVGGCLWRTTNDSRCPKHGHPPEQDAIRAVLGLKPGQPAREYEAGEIIPAPAKKEHPQTMIGDRAGTDGNGVATPSGTAREISGDPRRGLESGSDFPLLEDEGTMGAPAYAEPVRRRRSK